jgi:type II secretory ATPase GspE/PulE/Tfp pilus assembly ATPase PilB-like protein
VQASLTGHLVLSTLHTNDAPSSIIRLVDLGLEPFLLTATIEGVVAQRLVRRLDPTVKEAYTPSEEELMELALRPRTSRAAVLPPEPDGPGRRRVQGPARAVRDHGDGRRHA